MNDEKLLSILRQHLKPHTESLRSDSGNEHDILPSLFSALLESQLTLDQKAEENFTTVQKVLTEHSNKQQKVTENASIQFTETAKHQNEAVLDELKKLSSLTEQQARSIIAGLTQTAEDIKQQLASTTAVILQSIEKTKQQNETLEKKTAIVIYALAFALILLLVITLKLFIS